uniref:RING-type domain-containing protein n=1 Tax=Panagrellus redivivus TaxID=6233 RepID=A0A7E4ZT37_PANRE
MAQPNPESDPAPSQMGGSSSRMYVHDPSMPEPVNVEVRDNGNDTESFIIQLPSDAQDVSNSESPSDDEVVIHIRDGPEIHPSLGGRFNVMQARVREAYHSMIGPSQASSSGDEDDPDGGASNQRLAWHFLTQPPLIITLMLMFIVSIFLLIVKEMSLHTTLVISTIVSLVHYHDSVRFSHIVHSVVNVKLYTIFLGVIMRNVVNYIFWQTFDVYKMAILIPISGGEDSFFITLTRIVQAEIFVMDLALILKAMVYCYKWIDEGLQQRIYVWIDHTCYVYRMLIPTSQWAMYFNSSFLLVAYLMFKIYTLITRLNVWFKFTRAVVSNVNLGEAVSKEQLEPDLNCSICQSVFKQPRKLSCTHIFCASCIRTWIDTGKGDTCPLCRSQVCDSQVPKVKDYESFFPVNVF